MLKSNSKAVKEALREHVFACYQDTAADDNITVKGALKNDVAVLMGGNDKLSQHAACIHLAETGQFEVSNFAARAVLEDVLQESEEESARYNDNMAWVLYCRLVGRTVYEIITEE